MMLTLFTAAAAPAAAGASAQAAPAGGGLMGMLPIFIIFGVMIFFMMRSQKKQQQKREQMLSKIAKGTKVVLASGFLGTIAEVREKTFLVEIANNVRVEVVQAGIGDVIPEEAPEKK
ncbi:MAG: preprotein translocase subunit YajC [Lentisphaeria bacterium]|nr:preprotein translocase subunit YajC [Lentisphaeria bacterium]MBR2641679.1 preprotein translocase subunit YajC [Lentisphaeria bacterium]